MREKRSCVEIIVAVLAFPLISRAPRSKSVPSQRIRWRTERKHVQQQPFVITFPTIREEPAFGIPAVRQRRPLVLRPAPIRASIKRIGNGANFLLIGGARIEIRGRRQHTREQESTVDRRQLALPDASSGLHVKKMIIKTLIPCGV